MSNGLREQRASSRAGRWEWVGFSDPRIAVVFRCLDADEAAVAWAWSHTGGSWQESAETVGLPASMGEQVRRKLKRLGARHQERQLEALRRARIKAMLKAINL